MSHFHYLLIKLSYIKLYMFYFGKYKITIQIPCIQVSAAGTKKNSGKDGDTRTDLFR